MSISNCTFSMKPLNDQAQELTINFEDSNNKNVGSKQFIFKNNHNDPYQEELHDICSQNGYCNAAILASLFKDNDVKNSNKILAETKNYSSKAHKIFVLDIKGEKQNYLDPVISTCEDVVLNFFKGAKAEGGNKHANKMHALFKPPNLDYIFNEGSLKSAVLKQGGFADLQITYLQHTKEGVKDFCQISEANQNTFVLFDCLNEEIKDSRFYDRVHQILIKEKRDDALILTGAKEWAEGLNPLLQMQVLGQDGAFGEFCGNGALSCAAYLFDQYQDKESFILKTASFTPPILKKVVKHYVVELPLARSELNEKFITRPIPGFNYMEILEPHLLIEKDMTNDELHTIGRVLNERRDLFPLGINVDAWHTLDKDFIFVKTYERGVQGLTMSCGSGSACCAAFYHQQGAVRVKTPGGTLEVSIENEKILLKGHASYKPISL